MQLCVGTSCRLAGSADQRRSPASARSARKRVSPQGQHSGWKTAEAEILFALSGRFTGRRACGRFATNQQAGCNRAGLEPTGRSFSLLEYRTRFARRQKTGSNLLHLRPLASIQAANSRVGRGNRKAGSDRSDLWPISICILRDGASPVKDPRERASPTCYAGMAARVNHGIPQFNTRPMRHLKNDTHRPVIWIADSALIRVPSP
jgi:hypothetical protein